MAYILRVAQGGSVDASSHTPTLPAHVSGNLIVVCLSNKTGITAISTATSGWTLVGTQGAFQSCRGAIAWKIAASSAETAPTFSGQNDWWTSFVYIISDHDATTPIEAWQRCDWGDSSTISTAVSNTVAASSNSGSAISASTDSLLLYACMSDSTNAMRCLAQDLISDGIFIGAGSNSVSQMNGHRQHGASGTVPSVTMYGAATNQGGNFWVVSVKNASGGQLQDDCRFGGDEFQWYGSFGVTYTPFGTAGAPSTLDDDQGAPPAAVTIDGIDGSTSAATLDHTETTSMLSSDPLGTTTAIASSEVTAGAWVGAVQTLSANKDMSGKVFGVHYVVNFLSQSSMGAKGVVVAFADSSGNWVAYQLATKAKISVNGYTPDLAAFISLGNADVLDSDGTIDWTVIKKIGWFYHRAGSQANAVTLFIKNATLWDAAVVTGGSSGYPVTWPKLNAMSKSWYQFALTDLQASAQLQGKYPIQIGDGTKKTYFKATASSFEFPKDHDVSSATSQQQWNVGSSSAGITVYASASDTVDMSAALFATETPQPFTIHASSSTSATYSFIGASFVGWDVTWKTGIDCVVATFSGCGEIDAKGADFTNCTISDTTSTDAAIAFTESGSTLDNCTIDVTGTSAAYHLELGTSVTAITLTDVTFTGTPSTDKVHVLRTTGTVTINISGSTTLSAGDVTSAGATVSIVSDPINQVVIVSGFTSGSRIQIYDTTNATELFNGTASAGNTVVSGTTATWTDPSTAAGNRAIRVRVSYVTGATAKGFLELTGLTCGTTAGTESVTYPVTQVADTTYDDNAITGSTVTGVTFTDSSPDVVNIDVASNAITWPSIYAAWVYYAFTSTGIATDIDYIDGIDTANYLLSNMKIKNTSSPTEPLVVSGGYGRDATTGASVDLVDTTGGTLILAPDHVVSYAVGSGVTSQDKTDIATAVLTAAASAPIASNIKQVNSLTVDGTGTEADPWGPV